ncbi:uncharacterized protein LOC129807750 isoform X2 [Phlebotomus papatasi]|uniref:uncharacterized protein LOC129807750 isoform X2 n=1 Tax=Phlebotomus papatasi TaxID=29031 RepID=UPI002483EE5A|nr:uncharacterized protein LOC129807750 isoform X2 [Phlebotomus papatasi]
MKKMFQFPRATSANPLLLFAFCLTALSLCTAKHEDNNIGHPIRNSPVNHHENVIISPENTFSQSQWSSKSLIQSNEAQHDEKIIKSTTHDERSSSSNTQKTSSSGTGSAPIGVSTSPPPHPPLFSHRDNPLQMENIKSALDDDVRNSAMPHSSRHLLQRRDVRHLKEGTKNLCSISEWCKCLGDKILDVECRLPGVTINFNSQFLIPNEARSLKVHLHASTRLHIYQGFFRDNGINRILIEGPEGKSTSTHVEFMPGSLQGNKGSNPSIEIINCGSVVLKNGTFHGDIMLNITKCRNVVVNPGALFDTSFNSVFDSISDLRMQPNALNGEKISKVSIVNSHIDRLEKIGSKMTGITITNSTINTIASKAFEFLELISVVLENTTINQIEKEAFPNKLFCRTMRIEGCTIETISSEAIADCGFANIIIERNTIRTIGERGISATALTASVSYNKIERTNRHWLKIQQFSSLDVNNNSFGQFSSMNIQGKSSEGSCTFARNSIVKAESGSLRLPQDCLVKDVYFKNDCNCNLEWLKVLNATNLDRMMDVSYCSIHETLKHCFNATLAKLRTYYKEVCSEDRKEINCAKNQKEPKHEGNFIKPEDFGKRSDKDNLIYYISAGVVLLIFLLLLIGILIVWMRRRGKRHDRTELITPTPETSHHSVERVPKCTRLFSPEDRLIISQTLEKMKMKHPPEKYDQVYNNTQKLFNGSLTESEKVLTIGEIVTTLGKCENSGEDFVAFTDILYKHLAPKDNNQNDPVYAEPNLLVSNDDDRNTQLDLNHIYAEPNSVQQPLLNNEYAFPVDRNTESGLYTEPVVSPRDKS